MAGVSRTIQLNIVGDASRANAAFKQTGEHAQSSAKVAGDAFDGVLGTLNSSGVLGPFGDALDAIGGKIDVLTNKGAGFGEKMTAIGIGLGAATLGLSMIGGEETQAQEGLRAAINATGQSAAEYMEKMEAAAKGNEHFNVKTKDTLAALSVLTTGLQDPQKAMDSLSTITNMAAFAHVSLAQAATDYVKASNGQVRVLNAYGVHVKDITAEQKALESAQRSLVETEDGLSGKRQRSKLDLDHEADARKRVMDAQKALNAADAAQAGGKTFATPAAALAEVQRRVDGQAEARTKGFAGGAEHLGVKAEDLGAQAGQKFGGALTVASGLVTAAGVASMVKSMRELKTATQAAAVAESAELVPAMLAADAAALPLLVSVGLIGIAALELGVIAYEVYEHWDVIWPKLKAGAEGILHVIERVAKGMYDALIWPVNLLIKLIDVLLPKALDIPTIPSWGAAHAAQPATAALPAGTAGGGGDVTVHSHVHLDGKKVGEGVAKHTRGQLLRDQRGTVNTGLA